MWIHLNNVNFTMNRKMDIGWKITSRQLESNSTVTLNQSKQWRDQDSTVTLNQSKQWRDQDSTVTLNQPKQWRDQECQMRGYSSGTWWSCRARDYTKTWGRASSGVQRQSIQWGPAAEPCWAVMGLWLLKLKVLSFGWPKSKADLPPFRNFVRKSENNR